MSLFITAIKCGHSIACGLMLSIMISLAIQAHISFSSSTCDENGENLESGNKKCEINSDRTWALCIFYGGAIVFLIGTIGTCLSNGWIMIIYMVGFVTLLGVIGGYAINKTLSDHMEFTNAVDSIKYEVVRDKWGIYSDILNWILLIGPICAFILASIMIVYFIVYSEL